MERETDCASRSHLVPLPGQPWAFWRWVGLRGAGFPCARVLELAAPEASAAVDRFLELEDGVERLRELCRSALGSEIDAAPVARRGPLIAAIRRLKRGAEVPPALLSQGEIASSTAARLGALAAALAKSGQAHEVATAAVSEAWRANAHTLRQNAGDPLFREAVLWLNRRVVAEGIDPLLRSEENARRTVRVRNHERLVASYLQRFCAKNDTIGFFGPVGWARWVDSPTTLRPQAGGSLVSKRQVFLEVWAVEAWAQALNRDPAMRLSLPPRRHPQVWLEGSALATAGGQRHGLPPAWLGLFAACDGATSAAELARRILGQEPEWKTESAVLAALEDLSRLGAIAWTLEVPSTLQPIEALRTQLLTIAQPTHRQAALASLDELESCRQAVAAAAGDPAALETALDRLEAAFVAKTGTSGRRSDGKTYAGRTLVFEDCQRALDLELDSRLLSDLAPALGLVLSSARWLTHEFTTRLAPLLSQIVRDLRAELGGDAVPLPAFWARASGLILSSGPSSVRAAVQRELLERWSQVLGSLPGAQKARLASADLWPRAERCFAAPKPGWRLARFHNPDLLIAASSPQELATGRCLFVLGENHLATNTLRTALFAAQHPDVEELRTALDLDLETPGFSPVLGGRFPAAGSLIDRLEKPPEITARMDLSLVASGDILLELGGGPTLASPQRRVVMADCRVEERAGQLVVVEKGAESWPLESVLDFAFTAAVVGSFRMLPRARHVPRVTIDRLVVQRESWAFPANEVDAIRASGETEAFIAARRWARRLGFPRFVFLRSPLERKPYFVDFTSPALVELALKTIRRAAEESPTESQWVELSEMLPGPDQLWLSDAAGCRYTSELRLVALDLQV